MKNYYAILIVLHISALYNGVRIVRRDWEKDKPEVIMKPFWRTTLKVLKVIGKIFVWLTGADSPVKDDERRNY